MRRIRRLVLQLPVVIALTASMVAWMPLVLATQTPAVAATTPVPDQRSEFLIGADLASDDVIARSRHGLTHFKCPTRVEFVDELPRTPTGKVSRSVLRSRFQSSPAPLG